MSVTLGPGGSSLVTLAPVLASPAGGAGDPVGLAPIGLANMLNPGGALRGWGWTTGGGESVPAGPRPAGPEARLRLRGEGTLLLWSSRPPCAVESDAGTGNEWEYDAGTGALTIPVPAGPDKAGASSSALKRELVIKFA